MDNDKKESYKKGSLPKTIPPQKGRRKKRKEKDKDLLKEYELDDLDALAQERLAWAEMGDDYE